MINTISLLWGVSRAFDNDLSYRSPFNASFHKIPDQKKSRMSVVRVGACKDDLLPAMSISREAPGKSMQASAKL